MTKQPLGVKIFGVLFVVWGVRGVLPWAIYYPKMLLLWEPGRMSASGGPALIYIIYGLIVGTVYVGGLACGIGLLMLKNWARILTVTSIWLLTVLQLAGASFAVMKVIPEQWPSVAVRAAMTTGWAGLVTWYFLRPAVKAQFARGR